MKNMFEGMDERQNQFLEFLNTEEGQKTIKGFVEGPLPDYAAMFANVTIPEFEVVNGQVLVKPAKTSEE